MVNMVVYLNHEGYILKDLPPTIPQYCVCKDSQRDGKWTAYELNSKGVYEHLATNVDYVDAINFCVDRARNINRKHYKYNWAGASQGLDPKDCDTFALDGTPTKNKQMTVWRIETNKTPKAVVYYVDKKHGDHKVYEDLYSGCVMFVQDPRGAIEQRLLEQYRMHFGLGLYRYIADLCENHSAEFVTETPLYTLVKSSINFTKGWLQRAYRVGARFIQPDGRSTNLLTKKGECDWNVSQLQSMIQLDDGELTYLIKHGILAATQTSDEVARIVQDYLKDPEHKLQREYLRSLG